MKTVYCEIFYLLIWTTGSKIFTIPRKYCRCCWSLECKRNTLTELNRWNVLESNISYSWIILLDDHARCRIVGLPTDQEFLRWNRSKQKSSNCRLDEKIWNSLHHCELRWYKYSYKWKIRIKHSQEIVWRKTYIIEKENTVALPW